MTRLLILLGLLACSLCARAAPAGSVQVQMRDTGYVLGDFIDQRLLIRLPPGTKLDEAALPAIGAVNHWLELRERRLQHHGDHDELQLRYQIFAAVEEPLQLAVPGFTLRLRDAHGSSRLPVPAQPFYLSPVLPASLDEQQRQPRASLPPLQIDTRALSWGLALSLMGAVVLGLYLAWLYDRLPGWPRQPGPFARLLRRWRGRDGADYPALLRAVQHSFNASAGETLYADNIGLLFVRAPRFTPLREEIEALLLHLRGVFYEGRNDAADWPASRVLGLCRRLRERERGAR